MRLIGPITNPDKCYIDGQWAEPSTASRFRVLNCTTEALFATVAEAQEADVNRAPVQSPAKAAGRTP